MIVLPEISEIAVLVLAGILLAAAVTDVHSFTIPNRFCSAICLLYPAYVLAAGEVDWLGGLMVGAGALVVGFVLFARNLVGGGDAKLVAAVALWAGPELLFDFLAITALVGGVMALGLWLRHRLSRATTIGLIFVTDTDPDFAKRPMPYAVAIAAGGLYVAFTLLRIA